MALYRNPERWCVKPQYCEGVTTRSSVSYGMYGLSHDWFQSKWGLVTNIARLTPGKHLTIHYSFSEMFKSGRGDGLFTMPEKNNGENERTRSEAGRFGMEYDRADFLVAVEEADHATAKKVAERVGCSPDLARKRLRHLEDEGIVESTDLGRTLLWKLTEN